ncbi:hypothetical protein [Ruegeria sp. 6PALISEP08]|uniref:hypothetical protein n=1 Tax=Ruegeria sp. 6PALISEP08 TaxID=1225660 RepID=UPI00067EC362|nr:hypothetical protein [Ruegeria sp. 6PALISEP08]
MIDDEPQPVAYYEERNIWTHDPTEADIHVYETFASSVVDLVQVLDDNKLMLSRDVYARLFSALLQISRVLGEYEDGWNGEHNA